VPLNVALWAKGFGGGGWDVKKMKKATNTGTGFQVYLGAALIAAGGKLGVYGERYATLSFKTRKTH
jgi:hypothetical protein